MKILLTFIALLFATILAISVINSSKALELSQMYSDDINQPDSIVHAFDPILIDNPEYVKTENLLSEKIKLHKQSIGKYSNWNIWINLSITALTGLVALITSITAARSNDPTKKPLIFAAVITFLCTLLNFGQGQVNVFKEESTKKWKRAMEIRDELYSLADPTEVKNTLPRLKRMIEDEL